MVGSVSGVPGHVVGAGVGSEHNALGTGPPVAQPLRELLVEQDHKRGHCRFQLPDGEQFGIAAVTSTVTTDDGELTTYSMVTRDAPAGSEAADHWPRMPLVQCVLAQWSAKAVLRS